MERSDMSLSVSTQSDGGGGGCEWGNGNGISSLLAQKGNILKISFWRMVRDIFKFKNDALTQIQGINSATIAHTQVKGALESMGCRIKTSCRVKSVSSFGGAGYRVLDNDGSEETYDSVILGIHAPNALKVLEAEATHDELKVLGACQYVQRDTYLHRDQNLMPRNSSAWSAWNFLGTTSRGFSVTYWLNHIQKIESVRPFLVTLNPPCVPDHVLLKWSTSLPVLSVAAAKAYLQLDQIQGNMVLRGISKSQMSLLPWITGHGFHEDGLKAGKAAAQGLLGKKCELVLNPKPMIPSWTEAGARLLVARFFNQYVSIGNLTFVEEGGSVFSFGKACDKCRIKSVMRVHDPLFYWKGSVDTLACNSSSNEFFSLFMDKSMTYSCAIFKTENESLEAAQERKLSLLIEKARVKRGHHVLDIGFGWGSLAIQVVKQTGCKYTGVTLSEEQLKYAEGKAREAGLEDHITFLLCDYRKIPPCKYDAIISICMIEHVGHEYLGEFFACCESYLAEDGIMALQFISVPDERYEQYRRKPDFIKEYIFPGGCLPSLSRVMSAMTTSSRFSIEHAENIGPHYYTTLMCWMDNYIANRDKILALGFDEKFIRIWEYYLIFSAACMKARALGDYQVVFSRPGNRRLDQPLAKA
ncbi:Cyclopropane-fatty-acyl-phospholipid synthase [Triticum urartu]|uniref:Cyclopropane-fatty-acyl-phospholipid synthase n=1 Tax=Triticum urartu TaxID=4572 RepID=M7YJF6_TRIUA|nr:Cyclopropane-fatty-acyl-phospholipid synthase [Triticum urartu]